MNEKAEVLEVSTSKYPICKRYEGNPILTGEDFPAEADIKNVFNSGIAKYNDKYVMVCRVEDSSLLDRFWIAESSDGYKFTPKPKPVELPHEEDPENARKRRDDDGWEVVQHAQLRDGDEVRHEEHDARQEQCGNQQTEQKVAARELQARIGVRSERVDEQDEDG